MLRRIDGAFKSWRRCRRYRRDLQRLMRTSPHLIADIGLTPDQAEQEVPKPFWLP